MNIKCGYSVPVSELNNVEKALKNLKTEYIKFIQNSSVNFIFETNNIKKVVKTWAPSYPI